MRFFLSRRSDGSAFRAGVPGTPVPLELSSATSCALKDAIPPMSGRITAAAGNYDLHGLPFKLDDQHVVSLSSNTNVSVPLPLNRKVSGLVFWDAGFYAWPDLVLAKMKVNYADGGSIVFDFIGDANLLDWRAIRKIPKDRDACVIAWRGRKETSAAITTWLTYWRNPHPENQITSIELSSLPSKHEEESRVVFLGVTAMEGQVTAPAAPLAQADGPDKLETWVKENFPCWMKQPNLDYTSKTLFSCFLLEHAEDKR